MLFLKRLVFFLAIFVLEANAESSRPNVVFILTDDMGYGDLGSYGATDISTPNLDRLAREGVRLTNSYSAGPVCTPTRVAFLTGRYQQRVGLEWGECRDWRCGVGGFRDLRRQDAQEQRICDRPFREVACGRHR